MNRQQQETDNNEDFPEEVENKCTELLQSLPAKHLTLFKNMVKTLTVEDPVLILVWNHNWETIYPKGKHQVIELILANGGTDSSDSQFMFHFREFREILACQKAMRIAIPHAFHFSPEVSIRFGLPVPTEMAAAWILSKTQILSIDSANFNNFFWS